MKFDSFENFNPSDPKYKKKEDITNAFHRGEFAETEDGKGFVKNEAKEAYDEAKLKSIRAILAGDKKMEDPKDFLYDDAEKHISELVLIVASDERRVREIPETLFKDKKFILAVLRKACELGNGTNLILEVMPSEYNDDTSFMADVIRIHGKNYYYASERLKKDKSLALLSMANKGDLGDLPREFQEDRSFVVAAIKSDGLNLGKALEIFRNDREIVVEAVKNNGLSLRYASEDLKNDLDIVLEAVKQDEDAIAYVSEKVKEKLKK